MDSEQLSKVVDDQFGACRKLLVEKAAEYAPVDRLSNFKRSAAMQGITPKQALAGYMAKHTISIYEMIGSENSFSSEKWAEKIDDHINYLLLLKALLVEEGVQ